MRWVWVLIVAVPLGTTSGLLLYGQQLSTEPCTGELYEAHVEQTLGDGAVTYQVLGAVSVDPCLRSGHTERHVLIAHRTSLVQLDTPDGQQTVLLDPVDQPVLIIDGTVHDVRVVWHT